MKFQSTACARSEKGVPIRRVNEILKKCPETGGGVHQWVFQAACALIPHTDESAAFDLIKSSAVQLDKHYLGARYPSVLPAGVPFESYSSEDGDRALVIAQDTYDFVVDQLNLFMNDG